MIWDRLYRFRVQGQGRMYVAIAKVEVQDTAVIVGTLLIYSTLVLSLFDSGSTLMFVTKMFVNRICVAVEDLDYEFCCDNTSPSHSNHWSMCEGCHYYYPAVHLVG